MKKFFSRFRKAAALDLTLVAVVGGAVLAASFALAEKYDLVPQASEHVAVYNALPSVQLKSAAPLKRTNASNEPFVEKPVVDRARVKAAAKEMRLAKKKAAQEKREMLRAKRLKERGQK